MSSTEPKRPIKVSTIRRVKAGLITQYDVANHLRVKMGGKPYKHIGEFLDENKNLPEVAFAIDLHIFAPVSSS